MEHFLIGSGETDEVSSLDKTEEKPNHNETGKVVSSCSGRRDDTPEDHGGGKVDSRLSEFVEKQIGGN